jgi:hypothetical protein
MPCQHLIALVETNRPDRLHTIGNSALAQEAEDIGHVVQ